MQLNHETGERLAWAEKRVKSFDRKVYDRKVYDRYQRAIAAGRLSRRDVLKCAPAGLSLGLSIGLGCGGAAPAVIPGQSPATLNPVLWMRWSGADVQTDGGTVTSVSDSSTFGNTLTKLGGTNTGLYHTGNWGNTWNDAGLPSISLVNSQTIFDSTAASLLAVANGTNPSFTVITVIHQTNTLGTPWWEFYNTAFSNFKALDFSSTSLHYRIQDKAAAVTSGATSANYGMPYPAIYSAIRDGSNARWRVRRNGRPFETLAATDSGAGAAIGHFSIWGNTSAANTGNANLRELIVIPGAVAEATVLEVEKWLAYYSSLGWIGTFGGTAQGGGALIVPCGGLSNMGGRGSTNNTFPDSRCFMLHRNGHLKRAADPTDDHTGAVTGSDDGSGQGGGSCIPGIAKGLRDAGETRDLIFIPRCRSGSSSTQWNTSVNSDPSVMSSAYGQWFEAICEAAQLYPSAKISPFVFWIGEQDAVLNTTEATFKSNMAAVINGAISGLTARGCTFDKTCPAVMVKIAATVPTPGSSFPGWATTRTAIGNMPGTVAGTVVVDATDGPWVDAPTNLHEESAPLYSTGQAVGAAIKAAS